MLIRLRRRHGTYLVRQRARLSCALFVIACLLITGCNRRASLEKQALEARQQFQRGYDDQAHKSAQDGIARSAKYPELNWDFRILLAHVLLRHDKAYDVLQLLHAEPVSAIPPQAVWPRTLALGSAYCTLRKDPEADQSFVEAVRLAGADQAMRAELAMYQGQCQLARRREDDAEKLFQQTIQSKHANDFTRVEAFYWLGVCALRKHQNEKGKDWLVQALQSSRALQAGYFEERALGRLGYAYTELGLFDKALEQSKAAEKLAVTLHQVEDQEKWQLDIGRAYENMEQSGMAREYYKKALEAARALGDQSIQAKCLHNLVGIERGYGNIQQAEQYHQESKKLKLEGFDLRDWNLDEAFIASKKRDSHATSLLLALLPQVRDNHRLEWAVQAELARIYDRQDQPVQADEWFQRSIKNIDIATMGGNWPIFNDYVAFLVRRNHPERSLQVAQLARARALTEQLGVKAHRENARAWVARIQTMLRAEKAVVLAYYEAENEAFVWAITPNHLEVKRLATDQNELETLAASYAKEIKDQAGLDASPAQMKLYQILVKPVRDFVPPGAHVVLVADSALYRMNLETLISDDGRPHYWIDDVEIENASSLDLLLAGQGIHRKGRGLLLIGAPEEVDPHFPRPPHAVEEMRNIEKHFPAAEVRRLSGGAAVPEAYLDGHPGQFKYIDFATHGTADPSEPLDSALILSRGAHGAHQLLARDIVKDNLKLQADLVTISSCYGAGTDLGASEGLLGLQRAFLRAGAHQVIAALWNIDDESNPSVMDRLYAGLHRHETASQALRAAKLKLVHSGDYHSAPYYWAPLQVYTGR